jgi:hypothetical protein
MQRRDAHVRRGLDWLLDFGIGEADVRSLNPCVPGEFTLEEAYYVNSATPTQVYRGAEEGTLPLVAGRWYMLPTTLLERFPGLRTGAVPVARAPRLIPS